MSAHEPRTCPLCLGAGHPSTVPENQEKRQIDAIQRDFSSSLRASAPDADLYGRAPRGMSTDELHMWAAQERKREAVPEKEREKGQLEAAPQYKHIPGLPWGDPASYAKVSTAEELERAREALHKREAEKREREAQLALEQERKRLAEEKREQEAREYLMRESERVLREREEREMWHIPQEPAPKLVGATDYC